MLPLLAEVGPALMDATFAPGLDGSGPVPRPGWAWATGANRMAPARVAATAHVRITTGPPPINRRSLILTRHLVDGAMSCDAVTIRLCLAPRAGRATIPLPRFAVGMPRGRTAIGRSIQVTNGAVAPRRRILVRILRV